MGIQRICTKLSVMFIAIGGIFFTCGKNACSQQNTPEQVVAQFYKWYIPSDTAGGNPLFQKTIYRYVYPATVEFERINSDRNAISSDYFTKSNDTPAPFENMIFHKALKINEDTSLVPVSFKEEKRIFAVFLKKANGGFYIIKISLLE